MQAESARQADRGNPSRNPIHLERRLTSEVAADSIAKWKPAEVAKWATSKGFEDFAPALLKHQISGDVLPILGEQQLREIGFSLVGPRMLFQTELRDIQRGARMKQRNEIIWQADEDRMGPCGGCCPFGFPFCCWAQPPAHYKLNHYKLSIMEADVNCCGCCAQCCGYKFKTNNIDLDKIVDVKTSAEKPACCKGIGIITVQDGDGNHDLRVNPETTQQASQKIQMAHEDAMLRSQAVMSSAPGQAF